MSATTALMGGMSIFGGASDIASSIGGRTVTIAKNKANSAMQIADVYSQASASASQMRLDAMQYDNEAALIRQSFSEATKDYDETAAAQSGTLTASYASSGVALSGSALDVIASTENTATRRRMARQNATDSQAIERENMAAALRLNAKFAIAQAGDMASRIKLNTKFANDTSLFQMHSGIGSALQGTASGFGKAIMKGVDKKSNNKSDYPRIVNDNYDNILMA